MKKLVFILILLTFPLFINAASVSLSGSTNIQQGETLTLPIIVSDTNKIYGAQMNFTLDNDEFELLISKTTSSYNVLAKTLSPLGLSIMSQGNAVPNKGTIAKIYLKAKSSAKIGSKATLTLKNVIFTTSTDGTTFSDSQASNYTRTFTVIAPKSANNNLSNLEISGYNISFDKTKTSYTIDSKEIGASLKVTAKAEDEKATVKVTSPTLVEGKNTITVVVTAESGAKKTYTITVNIPKKEAIKASSTNLRTLTIKNYDIKFSPEKTEYLLNVENSVKTVEITSSLEDTNSTKKMSGPEQLKDGENIYEITVTNTAGENKVYRITINRKEAEKICQECQECEKCEESDPIWKILAIALVIVTLAETIYMVTMRDKKKI